MNDLEYLGEIEEPTEKIKSQIMINIIEGRHYYNSNTDTYAVVKIPSYFKSKTLTRKTTTSPSYFKKFIIDLPSLFLNDLLKMPIIITVYESHIYTKKVLGSVVIELSTIWSEPDKMFHNKWLTLVNREHNSMGVKGYLKCDLIMFYENESNINISLSKPDDMIESINENSLLIPSGFKMGTTHLARYSIRLYKGEMIHYLFGKGTKWLSIDFGEAPESSILLNINGTELNWNKEYSTINLYPPLCPTIVIKFTLSGKIVASRTLSMHNFIGRDSLPCFGPAFLHFISLETQQYFGRILISIETELVPAETENIKSLKIENILSIPDKELMYFKIIIMGIVFCVKRVHEKLIKSKMMKISMDYGEHNFVTGYEKNKKMMNTQTPEYNVIKVEKDFYKLSIEEDTKPCLFLVTHLTSFEYYAMVAMNLFSLAIYNMEICINNTLKNLNYPPSNISKLDIVQEMLIKLHSHYQRFYNLYNENVDMQIHIHTTCMNTMKSFYKCCSEEIKKILTLTYNETDVLTSVKKIEDILKQLSLQQKNNSCYSGPPNIFINVCNDKKIVSRCQIQTRHFLYSNIPELNGKYCGKIQPWFCQATEERANLFDGIIETMFWVGPYEDFNSKLNQIPGLLFNDCNNQPCLQYKYNIYDKTLLQFKAHLSQVILTETFYKQFGHLNLMTRIIFDGHSMRTEMVNSNVSISWNVSISFKPILFTRYGDTSTNDITPIYGVIKLCHVKKKKGNLIENVIAFTVLNMNAIDSAPRITLDWFDIFDRSQKIGKIFIAVEITRVSDELIKTANELTTPLLKYVQPKYRVYQLIVLFWGLRALKLNLVEPFVRMYCSGLYIDSDVIKNVISFPNFPNIMNIKCMLSIELPEDLNLIPPISFQLFSNSRRKKRLTPIGMCASQSINQFLAPAILEAQWNQPKIESPTNSVVLEIEDVEEKDFKIEPTKIKTKDIIPSNITSKFKFYFLNKCIHCINNVITWITEFVTPATTFLFSIIICLCPWISNITYWISTKYEHFIEYFGMKYNIVVDRDNFNEHEEDFNWWTKYYGMKYLQKNAMTRNKRLSMFSNISCKFFPFSACCKESDETYFVEYYSKVESITMYGSELESIPEFNRFEDNIKKFMIYGIDQNSNESTAIAVFKGNVLLYQNPITQDEQQLSKPREVLDSNTEPQVWPELKSNAKCNVIVRIYILRAYNLHPIGNSGLSDPFVEIVFGNLRRFSDHKNYIPRTLNPMFGRCYEREITLPESSTLQVRIMSYNAIGDNKLIGETTIDIESRYFSKHRAHCGLPKKYNKDGYNRWRDSENPSNILHKLCASYSLKPPIYMEKSVIIGSKVFNIHDENMKTDRQSLALYVLNHWQEMPIIGYHLVPEHVETRILYNPDIPNIHKGTLEMWIDMFAKNDNIPEKINITPPVAEHYELRVIIWSVADVKLMDDALFTREKYSDIYVRGWLEGSEKQSTDVHYRSINGEGLFNWRFKFSFSYNKTENVIIHKTKNVFSLNHEEQKCLPRLQLQIWDNDHLSPDSFIGYLILDLWNMPRGTKSPLRCTTSDKLPRINVFKIKKIRGWWPFISKENNKRSVVGKLDAEIQIMTKNEGDESPAGFGRAEPQPLDVPKRPSFQYLKTILDPFKFVLCSFCKANKPKIAVVFIILFLILFIYAIPGYVVKKILNAR